MAVESGIDDAWDSVFAEGLDDEGFLDDEKQPDSSQPPPSTPQTADHSQSSV